jgi:hypothetical protein
VTICRTSCIGRFKYAHGLASTLSRGREPRGHRLDRRVAACRLQLATRFGADVRYPTARPGRVQCEALPEPPMGSDGIDPPRRPARWLPRDPGTVLVFLGDVAAALAPGVVTTLISDRRQRQCCSTVQPPTLMAMVVIETASGTRLLGVKPPA